jgi:hypothetical protein
MPIFKTCRFSRHAHKKMCCVMSSATAFHLPEGGCQNYSSKEDAYRGIYDEWTMYYESRMAEIEKQNSAMTR